MKIQILTCFDLTDFFITFVNEERKFREKKLVKLLLSIFTNYSFWKTIGLNLIKALEI